MFRWYLSYSLLQPCLSQKRQNVIFVHILKLFTLKNRFLVRVKALHFMRTCLMVQGVWHVQHCGCCSCLGLVWLTHSWDIVTCSLLDFLKAGLHSPKVGLIWKSLLLILFQNCFHFAWRNLLILGSKSAYEILNLLGVKSKANLAAKSALSFPLAPMWLGIQKLWGMWSIPSLPLLPGSL